MHNTTIRHYNENDDLDAIINLYKSAPSFFPRDENIFRHFTNFPGVQEDGIFVVLTGEVIDGIAIVSIVEKDNIIEGKIIELLANSTLSMDLLVQKVEEYCRNKGADIIFLRPMIKCDVGEQCLKGWVEDDSSVMMVKPISILPILQFLLDGDMVKKFYAAPNISFVFNDAKIEVKVTADSLYVMHPIAKNTNSDVLIKMNPKTFLEIIFGLINPYIAYLTGNVKIHGTKNIFNVLKLLKCLKTKMNQSIAIVDSI